MTEPRRSTDRTGLVSDEVFQQYAALLIWEVARLASERNQAMRPEPQENTDGEQ